MEENAVRVTIWNAFKILSIDRITGEDLDSSSAWSHGWKDENRAEVERGSGENSELSRDFCMDTQGLSTVRGTRF